MIVSPSLPALSPSKRSSALRLGFVALTDAAPIIAAQELGIFSQHGLQIELSREVGWATIREKIIYGELDAAHCLAPMLWATQLGVDCRPCSVLTAMILSWRGNGLTLSTRLHDLGVRDAASLRDEARRRQGERRLTFGVVFTHSSHHLLVRSWLRSGGIDPDRDVRIVVVPPAQMFRNLAAGTIDGYCAGEPWNSVAIDAGIGWCPAWSTSIPGHSLVEKVLMVTQRFAKERTAEHLALVATLAEACAWCEEAGNREPLAQMLSAPAYLNQPAPLIARSLTGQFDCGYSKSEYIPDFHIFHRDDANRPTRARAEMLQRDMISSRLLDSKMLSPELPGQLFREDLFQLATRRTRHVAATT